MNNEIIISNIAPQDIKIETGGGAVGITTVYVNGVDVTVDNKAYVIVPTKVSELVNDEHFITHEVDPTVPYYIKEITISDINNWNNKQDALVSGYNIKTVNSQSLLGTGNIDISTSYSAGTGIAITSENVINNTITSYNDLTDLPTIPTKVSDLLNDSDFVPREDLSNVAFSGSYLDLSNTPDLGNYVTIDTEDLLHYYTKDFFFKMLPKLSTTSASINLTPTVEDAPLYLSLGATTLNQDATPTPSSPQDIHTISGDNTIKVEGKNLFNIQTIVKGRLDNGVLGYESNTTNLTLNDNSFSFTTNANYRGATTDYIIVSIQSYVFNSNTSNADYGFTCACYDENKNWLNNASVTVDSGGTKRTFTPVSNTKYIRIYFSLNSAGTLTITNPQLELGSTATTYEPYTSQEADIDLKSKNLFDKDNANIINNYALTPDGFFLEENDQTLWIPCESNTTYTISKIESDRLRVATTRIIPTSYPSTYQYINSNDTTHTTITTDNEAKYLCVFYRRFSDTLTSQEILDTIIICKGSEEIDYVPYYDYGEYCKIETYEDVFFKNVSSSPYYDDELDEDEWYIKKNIGKVVLDGSGTWQNQVQTGYYRYGITKTDINNSSSLSSVVVALSDNFKGIKFDDRNTDTSETMYLTMNNSNTIIWFNTNVATSQADFQTWLGTHNTTVYYVLSTPTYTQITGTLATQLEVVYNYLQSYIEQTNISQINNDLPFTITATTLKDLSNL